MNIKVKEADSQIQRKNQWLPEVGQGNIGFGEGEIQTTGCKIGSRMYCTTRGIQPIFCNNWKWKVAFKNSIKKGFQLLFSNRCRFSKINILKLFWIRTSVKTLDKLHTRMIDFCSHSSINKKNFTFSFNVIRQSVLGETKLL